MADLILNAFLIEEPKRGFTHTVTGVIPGHDLTNVIAQSFPGWEQNAMNADTTGMFSGTVYVNLTPKPFAKVSLYDRVSGVKIDGARTDINGEYTFTGLNKSSTNYYAVAVVEEPFNAIVWDKITPV
jgi:hypothetical protein